MLFYVLIFMLCCQARPTANPRTEILDFKGFDSSIILILGGEILMSIGHFPEMLSQRILVGIILVGTLGVSRMVARKQTQGGSRAGVGI